MKLSIITINYNNLEGLRMTVNSVLIQTSSDFEYIIVDGGSTDGSLAFIQQYNSPKDKHINWISEPDTGIYNAMNKGIQMAKGEYIQFLNSGDLLVAPDVTDQMLSFTFSTFGESGRPDILYGNMLKQLSKKIIRDRGFAGRRPTMIDFYTGTLNHSPAYLKRSLFETYGIYDESLKIVSDWKWYLQVIALNGVIPVYKDIDVIVFDMNGISNINSILNKIERRKVLEELLPLSVLRDYDQYSFSIDQFKRINRYLFIRSFFYFVERLLFKLEKWFQNKDNCSNL